MAVAATWKTASTSAVTTLVTAGAAHTDVMVRVRAGTVYLGGAAVSTADGLVLTTAMNSGGPVAMPQLWPGDHLYALGSSSGITVEVLTRYSTQAG